MVASDIYDCRYLLVSTNVNRHKKWEFASVVGKSSNRFRRYAVSSFTVERIEQLSLCQPFCR